MWHITEEYQDNFFRVLMYGLDCYPEMGNFSVTNFKYVVDRSTEKFLLN